MSEMRLIRDLAKDTMRTIRSCASIDECQYGFTAIPTSDEFMLAWEYCVPGVFFKFRVKHVLCRHNKRQYALEVSAAHHDSNTDNFSHLAWCISVEESVAVSWDFVGGVQHATPRA